MAADLRSDTVTRPSKAMREAMVQAAVGDDVYREDPTTTALEQEVAALLGKEAALFVPSGTMANQIAILCHTRPGDEVIAGKDSHCAYYESGAAAAWAGVQFAEVGSTGLFTAEELVAAVKPRAYYCPNTRLVVVENTHNRAGGRIFPQQDILGIREAATEHGLALHLDGARLWNAAAATGLSEAELAAPFDTVCVCFSKGLGAPIGSAICGSKAVIEQALRFRKMLGGGMRQVGVLAAAARYALEHHRQRLSQDHAAAKQLAAARRQLPGVRVGEVDTNIVRAELPCNADDAMQRAASKGVLFNSVGPQAIRLVTHRDVAGPGFDAVLDEVLGALNESIDG